MLSFFNKKLKKNPKKLDEFEAVSALQIAYDTSDVKKAEPIFDGETALIVNDTNFITLFENEKSFEEFYINALNIAVLENPELAISYFNRYLGKNKWIDYVPRNQVVKALTTIIEKTKGGIEEDLKEKITSQPLSLLRSFFNMSSIKDRKEFYAFVLSNNDGELITDTVKAILKIIEIKTVYFPKSNQYLKAFDWGKS